MTKNKSVFLLLNKYFYANLLFMVQIIFTITRVTLVETGAVSPCCVYLYILYKFWMFGIIGREIDG